AAAVRASARLSVRPGAVKRDLPVIMAEQLRTARLGIGGGIGAHERTPTRLRFFECTALSDRKVGRPKHSGAGLARTAPDLVQSLENNVSPLTLSSVSSQAS